jgi:hypothetical protein
MSAPDAKTSWLKGSFLMAAKKKTTATPPAKKRKKSAKVPPLELAAELLVEAPPVEPTPQVGSVEAPSTTEQVPPTEVAGVAAGLEAPQEPQVEVAPPAPEAAASPESTLRYWQVRRGPQVLGQTIAGSEEWALKYARQQFGDGVTVEPGRVAPGPKERAKPAKKENDTGKLSALDAAAKVLAETGQAMTCQELIGAMATKGYWSSPAGKTPASTLYSAMLREAATKGDQARFVKAGRGRFALRTNA